MNLEKTVLGLAAVTTGLIAGLFFAYQTSVNPAFEKLPDSEYIRAMQAINVAIQNPAFMFCFMGNLLFLGAATYFYRAQPETFRLLVAATLLYAIGVFGITVALNVPLNDALAKVSLSSASAQLSAARSSFQTPWNQWHLMRTIASVVCLVLVVLACVSSRSESADKGQTLQQRPTS